MGSTIGLKKGRASRTWRHVRKLVGYFLFDTDEVMVGAGSFRRCVKTREADMQRTRASANSWACSELMQTVNEESGWESTTLIPPSIRHTPRNLAWSVGLLSTCPITPTNELGVDGLNGSML